MIYELKNYSFLGKDILPDIQDGDVFLFCDLTQAKKGTELLSDKKDLVFIGCSCQNILPQDSWCSEGSNWSSGDFIYLDEEEPPRWEKQNPESNSYKFNEVSVKFKKSELGGSLSFINKRFIDGD